MVHLAKSWDTLVVIRPVLRRLLCDHNLVSVKTENPRCWVQALGQTQDVVKWPKQPIQPVIESAR